MTATPGATSSPQYPSHAPPPSGRHEQASVGELLGEVAADLSTLVRQEIELAKAEVTQSAGRAGKGAGMLAGAGVAGLLALSFLSVASWWALGNSIGRGWSALVVMLIWAIAGAVLASAGRKALQTVGGIPQTTSTVKKIPDAVKGNEGANR